MIGRLYKQSVAATAKHAEATVDELLIWNRQLSAEEIMEVKKKNERSQDLREINSEMHEDL